jgi:hypothetical protein
VILTLNTDYSTKGLASDEIVAVLKAWEAQAISTDTMHELFRRAGVVPDGRSNQEEKTLIAQSQPPVTTMQAQPASPSHHQPSTIN